MCCNCGGVLCATRPWKVCDVCWRLEVVLYALDMLESMHRMLLCMLETVEVELYLPEVMRCVLLYLFEVVEGTLCLWSCWKRRRCWRCRDDSLCSTLYAGGCGELALFAGDAGGDARCATLFVGGADVLEVMRSLLLCLPEVMRCVLLCCWRCWR